MAVRLTAPVELHAFTAPGLRETVVEAINNGHPRIVIDLSATTFIDATGLRALISACKRATAPGGWVRLAAPSDDIQTYLSQTREPLPVYPTIADAVLADAATEGMPA